MASPVFPVPAAAGIIGLAFVIPLNTFIGYQGTKMHNKCLLLVHAVVEAILIFSQIGLATALLSFTNPEVEAAVREDCIRTYPQFTRDSDCTSWFRSDRYAGFKVRVWAPRPQLSAKALTRCEPNPAPRNSSLSTSATARVGLQF